MSQPIGTLAHYRILEEVGKGGMGVVYKAHDTSLDRPVAIKIMPAAVSSDPDLRRRFLAEARHAARISHPNIATIHEADEAELSLDSETSPRPVLYIAMEYIEGFDLEEKMASGSLTLDETLDISIQISAGLEAAHAQKVVHRDLKPHNIRLTDDGRVKIVDFGLAKSFRDGAGASPGEPTLARPQLTRTGMMVGTPGYMAPEQAEGTQVDSRTDLFSLGILLYRMTSGKLPFSNNNYVQFLKALLSDEPEPLTESNPQIPGELELIVARLLQKDPEQRFQSAQEVRLALRRLAGGSTDEVTVGLSTPPNQTRATEVRSQRVSSRWGVITGVSLAAVIAIAIFWWRSSSTDTGDASPLTVAIIPSELPTEPAAASRCRQLNDTLRRRLGQTPGVVTRIAEAGVLQPSGRQLRSVQLTISCDGAIAPSEVAVQLKDPRSHLALWDRSLPFRGIDEDWPLFVDEVSFLTSRTVETLVSVRSEAELATPQLLADFLGSYDEALRQLENHGEPSTLSSAAARFADLQDIGGGFAPAFARRHEALFVRHRGLPPKEVAAQMDELAAKAMELAPAAPSSRISYARSLFLDNQKEAALSTLQNLIESDSARAEAFYQLGAFLKKGGNYEQARRLYSNAIRARPGFWRYRYQLGALYLTEHNLSAARPLLQQSARLAPAGVHRPAATLAVEEIVQGNFAEAYATVDLIPPPIVSVYHANVKAMAAFYLENYDEAAALYQMSVEIEPNDPSHQAALGDTLAAQGKAEAAQEMYGKALALVDSKLARDPDDIRSLVWRPTYLAKLGRCQEAIEEQEKHLSTYLTDIHLTNTLAKTYAECGDLEKARPLLQQIVEKGLAVDFLRAELEYKTLFETPGFEARLREHSPSI